MAGSLPSGRWLLAGSAAGVLAVLLVAVWMAPSPHEAVPVKATASTSRAPTVASAVAAYRHRPAASRADVAPAGPVARRPGPGEAEICGLGIVRVPDDTAGWGEPLVKLQHDAGLLAARQLAARADPRLRAAGLYYESRLAMRASDVDASAPAANRLATWALTSRDPWIYSLALQACRPGLAPIAGACDQLSVAQWARLDPANGVPWVFLAEEAGLRGDSAAEAEAYYRASQASTYNSGWGLLPSLIDEGLAGTVPEPARSLVDFDAWLLQADFGTPSYGGLTRFCSAEAVADANRQQVCESIAALQLRRGTFLDALVGVRIAERAGWPEARVSEERARLKQLMQPDPATAGDALPALDCASVQRRRERARLDWALGEVGAARQRASETRR